MVVCDGRMLEHCSYRLTLSNLEVNSWKSRSAGCKVGPLGGPSRPKSGIGARGSRGVGFAVSRQVARKQAIEAVGKGTTEDISAPVLAGANGNATKAGPKSQDGFRERISF